MNKRISPIIISDKASIREAMKKMQEGPHTDPPSPSGIVIVAGKDRKLLGVVTDGDIRRAMLKGADSKEPICLVMTKNPVCVKGGQAPGEMLRDLYREIKKRNASENKYHNIVVVDDDLRVLDVVTPLELWRRSEVKTKTVAVIGLGYVGLTLALTLNEFGIEVFGIDSNEDVIKKLDKGTPHFYEKGLEKLLKRHIHKNLFVKKEISQNESDVYIICVSTPIDQRGRVVLSYLKQASLNVGRVLKAHDLVILRSTVAIGTSRNFVIPILEKKSKLKAGRDFFVAFAPERTVEGKALEELRTLPQVIGGYDKQSADYASQLFQLFAYSIVSVSNLEEAESVKLLNNTFRDVSFAFSNEVAQICSAFNLSARDIIRAANEGYPRDKIPFPSPGVGGACLKKDPYLLAESAKKVSYKAQIPKLAREVNKSMIDFVAKKINDFCVAKSKGKQDAKIFVMGVAFKGEPETSDVRDSTSIEIVKRLQGLGYANIFAYDAVASKDDIAGAGVKVVATAREGFRQADCVLILNNHSSYRDFDIHALAKSTKKPSIIFDGWGVYNREELTSLPQVTYVSL